MAFLTLAGTTVEVQVAGAGEAEPTFIGEAARSFSGQYRSGVRGKKRAWQFTLIPMLLADMATLEGVIGIDVPITANGDVMGGAVTVFARVGQKSYIQSGVSFLVVASLALFES